MDIDDLIVSEENQGIEVKFPVKEIIEVEKGWNVLFSRGKEDVLVFVPHGYDMIRTTHPSLIKRIMNKKVFTIGKRRRSPVAVGMYGNCAPYQIDEINEIVRNGLIAKGMKDVRKTVKIPAWVLIGGLVIVLLVGGMCAMKQFNGSDPVEETPQEQLIPDPIMPTE